MGKKKSEEMTVMEAIAAAELILPGEAVAENAEDPRWQAIIRVAEFIESDPQICLGFALRWDNHADEDLRSAIAACLLEHLLEHHFEEVFPQVEESARANKLFADTVCRCWAFGQSEDPGAAERFHQLVSALRKQQK